MLKIIVGMILLFIIVDFLVAYKLFKIAFVNTTNRSQAMSAEHNVIPTADEEAEKFLQNTKEKWLNETIEKKVYINSHDGLKLVGFQYLTESLSNRWAILIHGFDSQHQEMFDKAPFFQTLGFNLLLPDARAHGESDGKYIGFGWPEREDIKQWIDFILSQDADAEIILYGVSMGGATAMMTAGEKLPKQVVAVIEDCGYSSVAEELAYQLKQLFNLPAFPLIPTVSIINYFHQGWWLREASSTKQLAKTRLPVLFIHGTEDRFVPFEMMQENYLATPTAKRVLTVEGAQHAKAGVTAGSVYWETVKEFLTENTDMKNLD
ncbi:alpha/beta hydrolase [Enterococcus sp. AZ103]|uniref:alpha/beta hydrolase n=1 Tax=Enterococcus sp. AZ103 TaxID=2774628 RepID=UPI003F1F368C